MMIIPDPVTSTPCAVEWSGSLPAAWADLIGGLDYAFQPIVQMRSGRCHGFEALLRGLQGTGFADPNALLDAAHAAGVLAEVEDALHQKAITGYQALAGWQTAKLFLNVDARVVGVKEMRVLGAIRRGTLLPQLTLEISERRAICPETGVNHGITAFREAGMNVALDDFGVGFSGLRLLHEARPDYLKIDRYFVSDIDTDRRKRAIALALIGYAHALGILIIAEGVETAAEFYTCRDLGCDFAQGYLIGRPERHMTEAPARIAVIEDILRADRRRPREAHRRLSEVIERQPALLVHEPKSRLLEYFGGDESPAIAPVTDAHCRPLGLIRERDIKRLVYSQFGRELLRNRGLNDSLRDLVVSCPVCDIATPLNQVIEAFSAEDASDGIIIIEGGEYAGFLSSAALIRLVHERNLAMAADQNPLTRLPGNAAIARRIDQSLEDREHDHSLIYFDFDNFKPFNDRYGFRQGDRAILLFSERLKSWAAGFASGSEVFTGHVGGDDFFAAVSANSEPVVRERVLNLLETFRSDVESLYDPAVRAAGQMDGVDRDGNPRSFPLLTASAVLVHLLAGSGPHSGDQINTIIATKKTVAKKSAERLAAVLLS